jgi:hypothetical protein
MKKSSKVTLTIVAAVGLASCSRRRDPCEPAYFNEAACQEAVSNGGYYWGGSWYPTVYHYRYPYYYDHYNRYRSSGGMVYSSPATTYARPAGRTFGTGGGSGASSPSTGGTVRGGFGSTGASHGSGS